MTSTPTQVYEGTVEILPLHEAGFTVLRGVRVRLFSDGHTMFFDGKYWQRYGNADAITAAYIEQVRQLGQENESLRRRGRR